LRECLPLAIAAAAVVIGGLVLVVVFALRHRLPRFCPVGHQTGLETWP
jgi:hypothetical protein